MRASTRTRRLEKTSSLRRWRGQTTLMCSRTSISKQPTLWQSRFSILGGRIPNWKRRRRQLYQVDLHSAQPIPLPFDHHLSPEPCLESTVPNADHLFEAGRDMIKMQAGAWLDPNCPSDHLTVQGRLKGQEEWTSAATRVEPRTEFNLNYLTPATWFHIKVQEFNEGVFWL